VQPEEIVGHLQQTIAWYHFVVSVNSDATDILQRDRVQRQALDATRLAFESARAEVTLMAGESAGSNAAANPSPQTGQSTNLQQASVARREGLFRRFVDTASPSARLEFLGSFYWSAG
jgi:hypothetical protein